MAVSFPTTTLLWLRLWQSLSCKDRLSPDCLILSDHVRN